jgi:hypothetical protein
MPHAVTIDITLMCSVRLKPKSSSLLQRIVERDSLRESVVEAAGLQNATERLSESPVAEKCSGSIRLGVKLTDNRSEEGFEVGVGGHRSYERCQCEQLATSLRHQHRCCRCWVFRQLLTGATICLEVCRPLKHRDTSVENV